MPVGLTMISFTGFITAALLASGAVAAPHGHAKLHQNLKRSAGKRGAAYNDPSLVSVLSNSGTVPWAYDWDSYSLGNLPSNVEYVPMLWGQKMFSGWSAAVETAIASGSKYILGFNEPDQPSQANMNPEEAAIFYRQYITPYADRATLVTPAVTNGGAPMGLTYMSNFLNACTDCKASVMAIHWYGDNVAQFKAQVSDAINLAHQHNMAEVWITEFALNNASPSQSAAFLQEVLPWLDSQSAIGRYAVFMCADGYLLSGNALNEAGNVYVGN